MHWLVYLFVKSHHRQRLAAGLPIYLRDQVALRPAAHEINTERIARCRLGRLRTLDDDADIGDVLPNVDDTKTGWHDLGNAAGAVRFKSLRPIMAL